MYLQVNGLQVNGLKVNGLQDMREVGRYCGDRVQQMEGRDGGKRGVREA